MFFWFFIATPILVAEIFRSPKFDYRLVSLGSLFPLIGVLPFVPNIFHSLIAPVVVLAIVMLATMNRRLLRRKWLAIPIGMLFHLILDGSWVYKESFWWPVFGGSLDASVIPEMDVSGINLILEVISFGLIFWAWSRYKLNDKENLSLYLRSGNLHRSVLNN